MTDVKLMIGDYVYASDWCFGEIVDMDDDGAWVEFETGRGGGTSYFNFDEIEFAPCPLNRYKK